MIIKDFILNNWLSLLIGVLILICIFIIVYKPEGFWILLQKSLGALLQKITSLLIETFCLLFKIVNALEIYVVLLIDALTGKTTANGKIASLAIGVLSIASFYTTYSGMKGFVQNDVIAFLITLGIQAILLSTSLLINDTLNITQNTNNKMFNKIIVCFFMILFILGCIAAYLLPILWKSYRIKEFASQIIYMVVICSALIIIFLLVKQMIDVTSKNTHRSNILFVIYFSVLGVSSFFSYNSFVENMYPESVREIDQFQKYRMNIIDILERTNNEVNDAYYENIKEELFSELDILDTEIEKVDVENLIIKSKYPELDYKKMSDFLILKNDLNAAISKKEEIENNMQAEIDAIIKQNPPNLRWQISQIELKYQDKLKDAENNIEEKETRIHDLGLRNEFLNILENDYEELKEEYDALKAGLECQEDFRQINRLLNKEEWDKEDEKTFKESTDNIEKARYLLLQYENFDLSNDLNRRMNNINSMIKVYRSYRDYKILYDSTLRKILGTTLEKDNYNNACTEIQNLAYDVLINMPYTNYKFGNGITTISTSNIAISDYYSELEILNRNTNIGLSATEKNIRAFLNNKLIGIVCAVIALLIDMMILFVGIILPSGLRFTKYNYKYSEEEIQKVLSNLFNKPMGR